MYYVYIYVFVRHFPPYFMTHRWILFGSGDSPMGFTRVASHALSRQWHRRYEWRCKPRRLMGFNGCWKPVIYGNYGISTLFLWVKYGLYGKTMGKSWEDLGPSWENSKISGKTMRKSSINREWEWDYHLVMTNGLPWKDPPFLRTVNHLFLWPFSTAMLNNQSVYQL